MLGGEVLTAEAVRAALRDACQRRGAPAPPDVIVASVWQGFGHEPGSGPLPANLPIVIDLWPRDEASGCWADMTRTFVVGEVGDAVRALEALVREAIERAREAVRPGRHRAGAARAGLRRVRVRRASHAENRTRRGGPERGLPVLARPRRRPSGPRGSGASVRPGMASWSPAT